MAESHRTLLAKGTQIPALLWHSGLELLEAAVRAWPGPLGFILRRVYYRRRFRHLGRGVLIWPGVRFSGHRYISIGDYSQINYNCMIFAGPANTEGHEVRRVANPCVSVAEGEVRIGNGVHITPNCYILGHGGVQIGDNSACARGSAVLSVTNHYVGFADRSRRDVYFSSQAGGRRAYIIGPVRVGKNVGVAMNCVLLPGAHLEDESFVMIGSVVRGTIPRNTLASGNPAVPIRQRFAEPPKADDSMERADAEASPATPPGRRRAKH